MLRVRNQIAPVPMSSTQIGSCVGAYLVSLEAKRDIFDRMECTRNE
jgi:hypothetical protein